MANINFRARAVKQALSAEKGNAIFKDYAGYLCDAIHPAWATTVKFTKARERSEEQANIVTAVTEERAAFYEEFVAGYNGDSEKPKDLARVYWNRIMGYALPKKERDAKPAVRGYKQRMLEELPKLIKFYYASEDIPAEADDVNAMIERAYAAIGGDLAALKEGME